MYQVKLVIPQERFRIVTHSYAASFSIKTCLDKAINIFLTQKLFFDSKICLHQQLFTNKDFCMKTRLSNYFIITNVMALANTVLEDPYRVLTKT